MVGDVEGLMVPLAPEHARRVYDRVGRLQDTQAFYERPATTALLGAGGFEAARSVFELGCGTGALAAELLTDRLGAESTYLGVDVSPRMVRLASRRLAPWRSRASIRLTDGRPPLGPDPATVDRFVATYVFDLLAEEDIAAMVGEVRRLLSPHGRLCVTSITAGGHGIPRAVSTLWGWAARRAPALTGGCRPLELDRFLPPTLWDVILDDRITAWGVTSQVLIAQPR